MPLPGGLVNSVARDTASCRTQCAGKINNSLPDSGKDIALRCPPRSSGRNVEPQKGRRRARSAAPYHGDFDYRLQLLFPLRSSCLCGSKANLREAAVGSWWGFTALQVSIDVLFSGSSDDSSPSAFGQYMVSRKPDLEQQPAWVHYGVAVGCVVLGEPARTVCRRLHARTVSEFF